MTLGPFSFAREAAAAVVRVPSPTMSPKSPLIKDAHRRSLAKAVSWRITGSIDTFVLSLLISGSLRIAGTISAVEVFTKILLFYFHERIWGLVRWGRR
jgi:uncharacterized membrane protein